MNPLRFFYVPLFMLAALALLAISQDAARYSWAPLPPLLGLAIVYALSPQIKWWYWRRYPPDLDTRFAPLLNYSAFYQQLDNDGKREFRRRAFLHKASTNFRGQALPKVPEDVQLFIAAAAATINFGVDEPRYDDFSTVVCYPHPFPSPQEQKLHLSELHAGDGVLIFSMPDLVQSAVESNNFLHLALYEYARAFQLSYPEIELPALERDQIQTVSRFKEAATHKWHGLANLDRAALTTVLYFTHSKSFQQQFPDHFQTIVQQLGQGGV